MPADPLATKDARRAVWGYIAPGIVKWWLRRPWRRNRWEAVKEAVINVFAYDPPAEWDVAKWGTLPSGAASNPVVAERRDHG